LTAKLSQQVQVPRSISADPALTWIKIAFTPGFAVNLNYFVCPSGMASASCGSPGTVYLNIENGQIFVGAGRTLAVQANPKPGFVFFWLAPAARCSEEQPGFYPLADREWAHHAVSRFSARPTYFGIHPHVTAGFFGCS